MTDPISALLTIGATAIDKIWPDPIKQAEEQRKLAELAQEGDFAKLNAHVQLMLGQLEINKQEAQSKSLFVAGWRPAVGWTCVAVLAFNYIGFPVLEYVSAYSPDVVAPEKMDMSELWPLLLGMLGIGGMRSFDKSKSVQTDSLG